MERVALLIDQLGKGDNVFEQFAAVFEEHSLEGGINPLLQRIQGKIELIERKLQDLSEKITANNENEENIYSKTIENSRKLLSVWLTTFHKRNLHPSIDTKLDEDMDRLLKYLNLDNIESKNVKEINSDFEHNFDISLNSIEAIKNKMYSYNIEQLSIEQANSVSDMVVHYVIKNLVVNTENLKSLSNISKIISSITKKTDIPDNENVIYTGNMKVWIDTTDAGEANRFMSIVSSALSNIENVAITIEESGVGTLWQKWRIKITGWFAKEETKQIIAKSGKAIESYSIDRHIEPIEKSKIDRKKTEEEIERMMEKEDVKVLQKIQVEKAKVELESMKLDNIEKKLLLADKLSNILAQGLSSVDSDYRIEIEGITLIKQEDGIITLGNIEEIDDNLDKSIEK